ncbi:uracil-DNA glycosylase [Noviherbaspirillum pedocola]|uniref:Type-4 uracil-DNA glycosylase n=1 Tax=Noviherbaspirillum pedocola TaxID=2801341 RepID=A0A934W709_9BURK|nr:uracil-DNA glycosylase [Noviherbaspirillum pedocola]MBK4735790.1 uracil-DNA glycosylase [Noviherbaspirillum pedocola]
MSKPSRREQMLVEMGLGPVWRQRKPAAAAQSAADEAQPALFEAAEVPEAPETNQAGISVEMATQVPLAAGGAAPDASIVAQMNWAELENAVAGCVKCRLCESRTKTVFGVGDKRAKWMFIGEGPGRNEDKQGLPFVGPAGKLLDNMLGAMGLSREDNAYIANVVKCRPTDSEGKDRPPAPDEAMACMPYLQRQIELIQPTVLVALGKTAAVYLLGLPPDSPVGKLRGQIFHYGDLPLVVTYHPAYLLRKLTEKSKSWADLCLAMEAYAGRG